MKTLIIKIIRLYQVVISPCSLPCCRFMPSCSQYTMEAVDKYGVLKGCLLGVKRIFKCHPWGGSGYDPVK